MFVCKIHTMYVCLEIYNLDINILTYNLWMFLKIWILWYMSKMQNWNIT